MREENKLLMSTLNAVSPDAAIAVQKDIAVQRATASGSPYPLMDVILEDLEENDVDPADKSFKSNEQPTCAACAESGQTEDGQ